MDDPTPLEMESPLTALFGGGYGILTSSIFALLDEVSLERCRLVNRAFDAEITRNLRQILKLRRAYEAEELIRNWGKAHKEKTMSYIDLQGFSFGDGTRNKAPNFLVSEGSEVYAFSYDRVWKFVDYALVKSEEFRFQQVYYSAHRTRLTDDKIFLRLLDPYGVLILDVS